MSWPDWSAGWWALLAVGWVGHACVWTAVLNVVYSRALPKVLLKPYRQFTGGVILAYPILAYGGWAEAAPGGRRDLYLPLTVGVGGFVFPAVTVARLLRRPPPAVVSEATETIDFWARLGEAAVGDGRWRWAVRLPGTNAFTVDFTTLTLAVPGTPAAWDGVEILVLSDLHFHGTPSKAFFDAVLAHATRGAPPDLVLLAGDYVDSDAHRAWIGPVLGRLAATAGKFAVLGNHDTHHDPAAVRAELTAAGFTVLGNGCAAASVRGEPAAVLGHEGPWFGSPPAGAEKAWPAGFRMLVAHAPDPFYWAARRGVNLMVAGHVHGGQIRLPVVGPIFVPSAFGRRLDAGVFQSGDTVMVVGRGVGGKEPLRVNCRPQVVRLVLRAGK